MSTQIAISPHITQDLAGRACIADTKIRVEQVAMDVLTRGYTAWEIHRDYPHLSMAQIHAALSYYYDNKTTMDAEMRNKMWQWDEARKSALPSPAELHLRELKLL